MPRTPEPDEDDLATTPPPPPVFHVEQALLGALLLEPHRLSEITGIGASSFSTAAHAALFGAIGSMPAPDPVEHATDASWLHEVLTVARRQARGLSPTYVHALVQVCKWPQHAAAYARIVEAEHARRRLAAAAHRLLHTAHDVSLPHRVTSVLAEAAAVAGVVDDVAARFPPHAGSLPRTPAPPTSAPHDAEAVDEELLLLATATAYPASVEQMRWLTADDFTDPLHADLWQCLSALTRRGVPVDPVTVLWEAQQRGVLGTRTPRELLGLLADSVGSPEHWGERVLQRSVLATAHRVGRRIESFIDDPATTPYQLVVGSRRALADLSAARARWQHATAPPAPAKKPTPTRASAAPRAGPPTTKPPAARIAR
ncbi:DnaB-like helicase N-terminal domain-containing protein [Streptomyces sp. NPDC056708]|uniref:DnaB-like helicase N-terminal domain-containing protein n=1 Tax=unclassified Streptomyces TaxID=2593676 RepID=UPI00369EC5D0